MTEDEFDPPDDVSRSEALHRDADAVPRDAVSCQTTAAQLDGLLAAAEAVAREPQPEGGP